MRLVVLLSLFLVAGCATTEREPPPTPFELGIRDGDLVYVVAHANARRTRPGWQSVFQSALDTTARACPQHEPDTSIAIYEALIANGANLNQPLLIRQDRQTLPLNRAAFYCPPPVLVYLVDAGARVNGAADDGMTPLMSAADAYYGNITDKVGVLIAGGANISAEDAEGRTALDYALANRRVLDYPDVLADLTIGEARPRPVAQAVE